PLFKVRQPLEVSSNLLQFVAGCTGLGRFPEINFGDGSDRKNTLTNFLRDGIVVDAEAGHIYWTNKGIPTSTTARSSRRTHGGNRKIVVPQALPQTMVART